MMDDASATQVCVSDPVLSLFSLYFFLQPLSPHNATQHNNHRPCAARIDKSPLPAPRSPSESESNQAAAREAITP
jgi:hypothetical protein